MPARNVEHTVKESVASVLACNEVSQLIVVNDGSTDSTLDVLQSFDDHRIQILEGPQSGISAALNVAFKAVASPYIARCDADDLFTPDRFVDQLHFLEQHSDYVATCSGFETIDMKSQKIATMALLEQDVDIEQQLKEGDVSTHFGTWLFRSQAVHEIGGARTWFTSAEDLDLQIRLAFLGKVRQSTHVTYRYRLHDASITHTMTSKRREFFDQQARIFARQRQAEGSDDLERNCPPKLPDASESAQIRSSNQHQADLMQGEMALFYQGR